MFGNSFSSNPCGKNEHLADIEKQLHRTLHHNGKWFADYRRIRVPSKINATKGRNNPEVLV